MNPQSRNEDLVVQEVLDELVIYDLKRDKVHSLNPTAAFVWQHCDGSRTPADLALLLQMKVGVPQGETLLWYTLDRLEKAHLLDEKVIDRYGQRTLTRREMLKLTGMGIALLPVVASIVAPTAAQAQTANLTRRVMFTTQNCGNGSNGCNPTTCAAQCSGCTGTPTVISCAGSGANNCVCCCKGCSTGPNDCT